MSGVVPAIPRLKFTNATGVPIVRGYVTVYLAGTSTLANTYQDKALTILNNNPVPLDGNGEAMFWLDPSLTYKFLLKDANNATVTGWPVDNILGGGNSPTLQQSYVDTFSGTGSQTVFTLSAAPGNVKDTNVYVGGVYQKKSAYNLAGSTLTFVAAPASGTNNIEVTYYVLLDFTGLAATTAGYSAAASASASDAQTSALAASTSEANAATSLVQLKNYFMGALASDPTTLPDGSPLVTGVSYFNTTSNLYKTYNGSIFQAADIDTANLAASSGSALIGSIPAGTGAVARTVQDKLRDAISLKSFGATGNGTTDDTTAIQNAINAAASAGVPLYVIGYGASYVCGNVTLPQSTNLSIIGVGAPKFIPKAGMTGVMWNYSPSSLGSASVTANIAAGDITFTVVPPAGTVVGDVVVVTSSAVYSGAAMKGVLARITALTGTSVTVDIPSELAIATTDTPVANFFHPIVSPLIDGVEFDLVSAQHQSAVLLQWSVNARINNCKAYGNGALDYGLSVIGFGGRITACVAENFNDSALTLGYGVAVAGHDMQVLNSQFRGCKHAITGGNNQFLNTNFLYSGNVSRDPYAIAFDAHSSCIRVRMESNYVVDMALSYANPSAFNVRGNSFSLFGNTVRLAAGKTSTGPAIQVIEGASDRISIRNNDIQGQFGYMVKGNSSTSLVYTNLDISLNTFDALGASCNALFFNATKASTVTCIGNKIINPVHGFYFGSLEDAVIQGNYVEFGASGIGLQANGDVSKTWMNVKVTDNTFKPVSASATSCCRIFGQSEEWVFANNQQDTSVATKALFTNSATAGYLLRVANKVGSTGNITVSGTAAPTAGTWAKADRVENSSPAVGSPKAWTCTVAGTPGTWVSEGNL